MSGSEVAASRAAVARAAGRPPSVGVYCALERPAVRAVRFRGRRAPRGSAGGGPNRSSTPWSSEHAWHAGAVGRPAPGRERPPATPRPWSCCRPRFAEIFGRPVASATHLEPAQLAGPVPGRPPEAHRLLHRALPLGQPTFSGDLGGAHEAGPRPGGAGRDARPGRWGRPWSSGCSPTPRRSWLAGRAVVGTRDSGLV